MFLPYEQKIPSRSSQPHSTIQIKIKRIHNTGMALGGEVTKVLILLIVDNTSLSPPSGGKTYTHFLLFKNIVSIVRLYQLEKQSWPIPIWVFFTSFQFQIHLFLCEKLTYYHSLPNDRVSFTDYQSFPVIITIILTVIQIRPVDYDHVDTDLCRSLLHQYPPSRHFNINAEVFVR